MLQTQEKKHKLTEDLTTAIYSTKEFMQKIKVGDTFFALNQYGDKPINISKHKLISYDGPETECISILGSEKASVESYLSSMKRSIFPRYINDFFWHYKMIFLNKKDAEIALERFKENYNTLRKSLSRREVL